jgi:predicted AAA+ superfamily ATPase
VRELVSWPERIEVAYYREKDKEVDFVLTHGGDKYLPIEGKSGESLDKLGGLKSFMKRFGVEFGVVVTRRELKFEDNVLFLPLRYFLLAT